MDRYRTCSTPLYGFPSHCSIIDNSPQIYGSYPSYGYGYSSNSRYHSYGSFQVHNNWYQSHAPEPPVEMINRGQVWNETVDSKAGLGGFPVLTDYQALSMPSVEKNPTKNLEKEDDDSLIVLEQKMLKLLDEMGARTSKLVNTIDEYNQRWYKPVTRVKKKIEVGDGFEEVGSKVASVEEEPKLDEHRVFDKMPEPGDDAPIEEFSIYGEVLVKEGSNFEEHQLFNEMSELDNDVYVKENAFPHEIYINYDDEASTDSIFMDLGHVTSVIKFSRKPKMKENRAGRTKERDESDHVVRGYGLLRGSIGGEISSSGPPENESKDPEIQTPKKERQKMEKDPATALTSLSLDTGINGKLHGSGRSRARAMPTCDNYGTGLNFKLNESTFVASLKPKKKINLTDAHSLKKVMTHQLFVEMPIPNPQPFDENKDMGNPVGPLDMGSCKVGNELYTNLDHGVFCLISLVLKNNFWKLPNPPPKPPPQVFLDLRSSQEWDSVNKQKLLDSANGGCVTDFEEHIYNGNNDVIKFSRKPKMKRGWTECQTDLAISVNVSTHSRAQLIHCPAPNFEKISPHTRYKSRKQIQNQESRWKLKRQHSLWCAVGLAHFYVHKSISLLSKFFDKRPPDGLLKLSDRVYVLDSCFSTKVLQEVICKTYLPKIITELHEEFPESLFLAFDFRKGEKMSQFAQILYECDVTSMDFLRQYDGCPFLLLLSLIHNFIRVSESWLSVANYRKVVLFHGEKREGWPLITFVLLASFLVFMKLHSCEIKTLEMVYRKGPRDVLMAKKKCELPLGSYRSHKIVLEQFMNIKGNFEAIPNKFTLDSVVKVCGRWRNLWSGRLVHGLIVELEFENECSIDSALIPRVQRTIFVELDWNINVITAKQQHLNNGIESARRAVRLFSSSIDFTHPYTNVLYEAANQAKEHEEGMPERGMSWAMANRVDPITKSLQERNQQKISIGNAQLDHVHSELCSLIHKSNIGSISSWMKKLGNGEEKFHFISITSFFKNLMELRLVQARRPNELNNVDLEEQRNSEYLWKTATLDERRDWARIYWNSVSLDGKDLLKIKKSDLRSPCSSSNDGLPSEVLEEALSSGEANRVWRFWSCCRCYEKLVYVGSLMWHVVHEHMGSFSQKTQSPLPNNVENEWAEMLLNYSWKPLELNSAARVFEEQLKSDNRPGLLDFFPQSAKADWINPMLLALLDRRYELMCKCPLEKALQVAEANTEDGGGSLLPYVLLLHPFCLIGLTLCVRSSNFSQLVITLQPYLENQSDNRVAAPRLESILFIIDFILPLLCKLTQNVVEELEQEREILLNKIDTGEIWSSRARPPPEPPPVFRSPFLMVFLMRIQVLWSRLFKEARYVTKASLIRRRFGQTRIHL